MDNGRVRWLTVDLPTTAERARLAELPGVVELRELRLPRGRGLFFGAVAPLAGHRLPRPLSYLAPWSLMYARFG